MTQPFPTYPTHPSTYPERWRALSVLLLAGFLVLLDTSIVVNGLSTIQRDLEASYAQVQLVLAGYSVAYGMLLITGGRLGDLYGRKRLFVLGLSGFILTSALSGLAPSAWALIAFRVLQGVSAGLMFPQISSLTQTMFSLEERPRAFGLQGAMVGLGIVAGPLIGGTLIGADLFGSSWRPIFLINVPLGLLTLWLATRLLPERV
jgi:MFS family permease